MQMQKNAKKSKKCNLQGKQGVQDKKGPFKMVQKFSSAPSAPVTGFLFKALNARISAGEKPKNAKNATFKGEKPLGKKGKKRYKKCNHTAKNM